MKSQFMRKHSGLHQHQLDMSQQQTVLCPITTSLAFTEQSTLPLLASVQLTPPRPEPSTYDQTTIPAPELPSHNQATAPTPALHSHNQAEVTPQEWVEEGKVQPKKSGKLRLLLALVLVGLGCAVYFIWYQPASSPPSAPLITPAPYTSKGNGNNTTTNTAPTGGIQVYITGAVQHPGVYTLSSDARIYQLLDAAGGPLPNANLATLNLAAKLVDGQEVYVSQIGETPPVVGSTSGTSNNSGQLVNVNTASLTDLEKKLSLSAKSAQEIITYRQQHGPFLSIDEVQQAVSKTIYDKIKNQITV